MTSERKQQSGQIFQKVFKTVLISLTIREIFWHIAKQSSKTTQITMNALAQCLELTRQLGLGGVILLDQQHPETPFVAMCVNKQGHPVPPRNWNPQITAEAAIEDLRLRLDAQAQARGQS